jgi:hypothetical protein
MKKNLVFCFVLLSTVWLSCKKDDHSKTGPQGKLYPIAFNVTNFTQENTPIDQNLKLKTNAVTPEASNILEIIYKIYNAANTLKKTVVIKKGQPNFGTIKDSLATGSYTAVFVGLTDTIEFHETATTFSTPLSETFYKKISFTVGASYLQQDVVLQRLDSQLKVVIKDAIPAGVTQISVVIGSVDTQYNYFADTSSNPERYTWLATVPANKIGTTNFTIGPLRNILATNHTTDVTITATKAAAVVAKKTIHGIQLQRNTLTILTGNLFITDPTTGGFVIGYEPYNPIDLTQTF